MLRAPGRALITGGPVSIGMFGFVLALLSTVRFDGLLGIQVMALSYALLSDPLGRGWGLFGTAKVYPDIGIVDARFTWYLAITSIVAGHVISIWLAHRLALREVGARGRAVAASIPLTVLMVFYTVVSLLIVADPLVQ